MTLRELYEEARKGDTPGMAFVREVMTVTKRTEIPVRRWLSGDVIPDALTRSVLAKHFGRPESELFPSLRKEGAGTR